MKLLADECFDGRLAARLRFDGHDVVRVPAQSGLDDLAVAMLAEREDRLLLTQDTDFGAIVLKHGSPRTGVVIVRASITDIDRVARRLARLIERASGDLAAAITVLDDRGVRSRPIGWIWIEGPVAMWLSAMAEITPVSSCGCRAGGRGRASSPPAQPPARAAPMGPRLSMDRPAGRSPAPGGPRRRPAPGRADRP
jgi:predicted nuclease of predicted toxin-antitoxin system